MLDYQQLKEILPHAYPFLLIDRVEEYKEGESLTALKNITGNEWCVTSGDALSAKGAQGYLNSDEGLAAFPETLLIEAAAQAALVLYHVSKIKTGSRPLYFLGRANSEFIQQVEAGDQLQLRVSSGKMLNTGGYSNIRISRGKEKISDVEIFYSVRNSNG